MSASTAPMQDLEGSALNRVRLRLVDTASDLRPREMPNPEALRQRLEQVVQDLASIAEDIRLLIHLSTLDHDAMEAEAAALVAQLGSGAVGSEPATDEWLSSLEQRFG